VSGAWWLCCGAGGQAPWAVLTSGNPGSRQRNADVWRSFLTMAGNQPGSRHNYLKNRTNIYFRRLPKINFAATPS
jgi:hypothetical protein